MNRIVPLCSGLLALHLNLAVAQWQPHSIATGPTRSPVFVAGADPSTGLGELQARTTPAHATALWSASARLAERLQASDTPRSILSLVAGLQWDGVRNTLQMTPLGAVRNANPWVGPGNTVFVGSMDGMLHAFDTADGSERFAYVPRGLVPRLAQGQKVGVDGPLFGGQAPILADGAPSHLLVAALGTGGNGFMVLNLDHAGTPQPRLEGVVLLDLSDSDDADLGRLQAPAAFDDLDQPRHVVRLQDGRPALVIGNGYHSARGAPVLIIQYLDQARERLHLSPCTGLAACVHAGANGLAMPRLLDSDGDGRVDLAYAGDLQGQLWKFDLGGSPRQWRVAYGGQPLFTACDAHGRRQPITTTPYAQAHPLGGWMLVVGTGRHLDPDDATLLAPQSIYGVRDDGPPAPPPFAASADCIRPSNLGGRRYLAAGTAEGMEVHAVVEAPSSTAQTDTPSRGWWIDLPHPGQRVLRNPRVFEGRKLLVHSVVPSGSAHLPTTAGQGYLSVLNLLTGLPPAASSFDLADAGALAPAIGMVSAPAGEALLRRTDQDLGLHYGDGAQLRLQRAPTSGVRIGWRERQ